MKVAESKTKSSAATTAAKTSNTPFFSKETQGASAFFGGETAEADPFFSPRTIQPKLTIGKPNDHYEQQADAVADQVVTKLNSPTPSVPPTPKGSTVAHSNSTGSNAIQAKCDHCEQEEKLQKKEEDITPVGEQVQMKPIFDSAAEPPPDDVQRKCAECEKEEQVQKKGNDTEGGQASNDLSSRLSASKGGGQPLPNDTRASMESAMGADFSNVRVHTGSEAVQMSQGINAQAFTHGSDVYFNEGKYDTGSTGGQHLLAHELTHTVQQGSVVQKKIQRQNGLKVNASETKDQFAGRVLSESKNRLNNNIVNLEKWRTHIKEQFDPISLRAQIRGHEATELFQNAAVRGRGMHFENWCNSHRPNQRLVEENVMNGFINGGCTYCHVSNLAWQRDNELLSSKGLSGKNLLPSPLEMLQFDAAYSEAFQKTKSNGGSMPNMKFKYHTSGEIKQNTQEILKFIQQVNSKPTANNNNSDKNTSASIPTKQPQPAGNQIPYHSSGLCGDNPKGENTPAPPQFDMSQFGPCSLAALAAIEKIRPSLEPLGSSGYQVLPKDLFSKLYSSSPEEISSMVMSNIDIRQQKYQTLINNIDSGKVTYFELCRMVDELLPTTNITVRNLVIAEKKAKDLKRSWVDTIISILGWVSLLLIFIFPPAGLLLSAAVGGAMMGRGLANFQRGQQQELGIGAGVFSKSQEEEAKSLMASGVLDIVMGAINAVTSVAGLKGLSGTAGKTSTTPLKQGWTVRSTPAGNMWNNPKYPNIAVWQNGTSFEMTNLAGEVIAHASITPNGWWVVVGKQPVGLLPAGVGGAEAATNTAASGANSLIKTGANTVPKSFSGVGSAATMPKLPAPSGSKILNNKLPTNSEIIPKGNSLSLMDTKINELIGTAEVNNGIVDLAIYRKNVPTQLKGSEVYNAILEEVRLMGKEIKGVRGIWGGDSDNLTDFNSLISKGATPEESALGTWSGGMAKKNGFMKVQIEKMEPKSGPPYTSVRVLFY